MVVLPESGLLDVEGALERRHLLLLHAKRAVGVAQARERHGQAAVLGAEALLLDGQGPLEELPLHLGVAQVGVGVRQVRQHLRDLRILGTDLRLQFLERFLEDLDLPPGVAELALDRAQQRPRAPQHLAVLLEAVLRALSKHALQPLLLLGLDVPHRPRGAAEGDGRGGGALRVHARRGLPRVPARRPGRLLRGLSVLLAGGLALDGEHRGGLGLVAQDGQLEGLVGAQGLLQVLGMALGAVHLDDEVALPDLLVGEVLVPVADEAVRSDAPDHDALVKRLDANSDLATV
mmetsp:Transcript_4941/g.13442  ORF Transcript_4941/g.13442 Transcript_4941/m.13442 type:complete len:290 (+) Transcript_4941:241-1110(+)